MIYLLFYIKYGNTFKVIHLYYLDKTRNLNNIVYQLLYYYSIILINIKRIINIIYYIIYIICYLICYICSPQLI